MAPLVESLIAKRNKTERVIIYCRTIKLCVDIFEHFNVCLGDDSSNAEKICVNGMYTLSRIKEHILTSMCVPDGVVRIIIATIALGMGVNFSGLNTVIHYGAPSSITFKRAGELGALVIR